MGLRLATINTVIGLVLITSCSSVLFADTFLPGRSNLNTIMSKDDFRSAVNNLGQQNQQSVKQQVLQSLPKQSNAPARSGGSTYPSQPATVTPPSYSSQANQPAAAPAGQQPASSGGVYTGFGAGTSAPSTPSNNGSKSSGSENSGWNINY